MTGATDHAVRLAASLPNRLLNLIHQERLHGHRVLFKQYPALEPQAAPLRNFSRLPHESVRRTPADVIGSVPYIKTHLGLACNHVCGSRLSFESADRRDKVRLALRRALDRD